MSGAASDATPSARARRWLLFFQVSISVVVAALGLSLAILPGLNGIVAGGAIPMVVGYAVVVGLPAACFACGRWGSNWIVALATGAAVGTFPAGLFGLRSIGPLGLLAMAAIGAATGLAALVLLRLQELPTALLRGRYVVLTGLLGSIALVGLASAGTLGALKLIAGPKDETCHNLGRYGGKSFKVDVVAELPLSQAEWPKVRAALAAAAGKQGWSIRDYTNADSLGLTLCQEPGTRVSIQQWAWTTPPEPALKILVVAPQGGGAWRAPTLRLLDSLDGASPSSLKIEPTRPTVSQSPPSSATAQKANVVP